MISTQPLTIEQKRPRSRRRLAVAVAGYAGLTLAAAFLIIPLLWAISASFTPLEKVTENAYPFTWRAFFPTDFTLAAYRSLFTGNSRQGLSQATGIIGGGFGRALINSLIISLVNVVVGGLIAAMAGFALARFQFPGKRLVFGLVLISIMIPMEVIIIPLFILVMDLRWVNTWQGMLLPMLSSGVAVFLFRQAFSDLPQDFIDAARVDGASWLQIFFGVALPLSLPVIVSAGLFLFLETWNAFFWPLVVASQPDMRVVQVAVSLAKQERRVIWNQLMAGSILAAAIPILIMLPFQRYYVSGLVDTGLRE